MTLKAPRPKRSHTRQPPKRAKPYARKGPGKLHRRWIDEMNQRPQEAQSKQFYPPAED
jgi:hypothetical protein